VDLVAISADAPEKSRALAQKLGLQFPLLSDPGREVIRGFGVEDAENGIAWPAIFILDADRRVAWRSLAETFKVRPASAVVLQALDSTKR
jgi:peroxiredoxin